VTAPLPGVGTVVAGLVLDISVVCAVVCAQAAATVAVAISASLVIVMARRRYEILVMWVSFPDGHLRGLVGAVPVRVVSCARV
jgi:hypothetical protein